MRDPPHIGSNFVIILYYFVLYIVRFIVSAVSNIYISCKTVLYQIQQKTMPIRVTNFLTCWSDGHLNVFFLLSTNLYR